MSNPESPCTAMLLADQSIICPAHRYGNLGCTAPAPWQRMCLCCHTRTFGMQYWSRFAALCLSCWGVDIAVSRLSGVPRLQQNLAKPDLYQAANPYAQVRFLELWMGLVPWQLKPVQVRRPASSGQESGGIDAVSWQEWVDVVGDTPARRVAEFKDWSAAVDPSAAALRAAAFEHTDILMQASLETKPQRTPWTGDDETN